MWHFKPISKQAVQDLGLELWRKHSSLCWMAGSRDWKESGLNNGYFQCDWRAQNHSCQIQHKTDLQSAPSLCSVGCEIMRAVPGGITLNLGMNHEKGGGEGRKGRSKWAMDKDLIWSKGLWSHWEELPACYSAKRGPLVPQGTLGSHGGWLIVQCTEIHATHPSGKYLCLGNNWVWWQIIMHGTLKELILVKQHDKSLPKGVFKSASILNINWLSNRHVRVSATGHGK